MQGFCLIVFATFAVAARGAIPLTVDEHEKANRFSEALAAAKEVHAIAVKDNGPGHANALAAAHRVGGLELLGTTAEADITLTAALKAADKSGLNTDILAARLMNDVGVAKYRLAKFADAKAAFERAMKIRTDKLGSDHPDTLQSLRNLGWAEEGIGNTIAACQHLRDCHDRLIRILSDPNLVSVSSAEAIVILEPKPTYPHLRIVRETRAGFGNTQPKEVRDRIAQVAAYDRVVVLKTELGEGGEGAVVSDIIGFQNATVGLAEKYLPKGDYRKLIAFVNSNRLNPDPTKLPQPFGPDHPVRATVLLRNSLVNAKEVAAFRLKHFGKNHPLTLAAGEYEALGFYDRGDLVSVRQIVDEVLSARRKTLGERHPATLQSENLLGVTQYSSGEIAAARSTLDHVVQLRKAVLPKLDPEIATAMSDLAVVARHQGDYATARRLLQEAYDTLRTSVGPKAYSTRTAGNNLAVVQIEMGDLATAIAYFQGVQASTDATIRDKDEAAMSLADIARTRGNFAEAKQLYEQTLVRSPNDPRLRNLLGATCRDAGDLVTAETHLVEAVRLRKSAYNGHRHPNTAFALSSLGLLYQAKGQYAEAVRELEASLAIYQSQSGLQSRNTAELLSKLGLARMLAGDLPGARSALEDAIRIKQAWARDQLPYLSEADAMSFIAGLGELDPLLTTLSRLPGANASDAYAAVWTTKGMATRSLVNRRRITEDAPEVRAAAARLHHSRTRLAELLRSRDVSTSVDPFTPLLEASELKDGQQPFGKAKTRASFEKQLLEFNAEKEQRERDLIATSASFRRVETTLSGSPSDLAKYLSTNAVVIDIVKVRRWLTKVGGGFEPKPIDAYEAFAIRAAANSTLAITRIDLGPADAIDRAIAEWRANTHAPLKAGVQLRELVWAKLAPSVGTAAIAILVPDGSFSRLPFAALPGSMPGTYLVEELAIVTTSHAQSLLQPAGQSMTDEMVLVGGVNYDVGPTRPVTDAPYRSPIRSRDTDWAYLAGTKDEVEAIAKLAPKKPMMLTGIAAGKAGVTQAIVGASIVHIATHGYFAEQANDASVMSRRGLRPELVVSTVVEQLTGRNPMVMNGLVLAGANASAGRMAGVLTAEEIVDWDLSQCELAVLSACETGLGQSANGEGVLGLQRAFQMAGARTTITTLWQIPDAATQKLMTRFYGNLWQKKMGKLAALREAQLWMLREGVSDPGVKRGLVRDPKDIAEPKVADDGRLPPFYWAAFSLAGDWR